MRMLEPTTDTTDVFVGIRIPSAIRQDWSLKRYYDCRCGFDVGKHPVCIVCGLAIGPDHLVQYAAYRPVNVYADAFNDRGGYWEVILISEMRPVCYSCLLRDLQEPIRIIPIRRHSRVMNRWSKINAWRKRRGMAILSPLQE